MNSKYNIINKKKIHDGFFKLHELIIWKIDETYSKVGAARLIELIKNSLNDYDNVSISNKHNLVLTTNGRATQEEVLEFASEIQLNVKNTFNIDLEVEPRIIF